MSFIYNLVLWLVVAFLGDSDKEIASAKDAAAPNKPPGALRGAWLQTVGGRWVHAYRGLRYAYAPVGPLRFKPPQPLYSYSTGSASADGVVDAVVEGPACPQPSAPGYFIHEDCLRLNVYTPVVTNSSKTLLPVVIFIHPGSFYSFSGRGDAFGPHYLLDRELVLVTINYRLGSLGFLSTGDPEAPGNNGFKDQVAALRWVQRNIAAFGGDPNLVTIAGAGAGAVSVVLHLVSPMSKGLFHRAISVSGSPINKGPLASDQLALAQRQAALLDCPVGSSKDIIACLRTKSAKEIGDTLEGFYKFGFDPMQLWAPVVEPDFGQEQFLPFQPLDAVRRSQFHNVPFMVSQTTNELFFKAFSILDYQTLLTEMNKNWEEIAPISFALPSEGAKEAAQWLREVYLEGRPLVNDSVAAAELGRLYGDALIGLATHRIANLMCRNSAKLVFYNQFDYIGAHSFYESENEEPLGVAHQDDLLYLFSSLFRFPLITPVNGWDYTIMQKMTAIWYNFARFGDPNPQPDTPELSGLRWPPMTPQDRNYLRISDEFSVHNKLFEEWFQIWEELYPMDYEPEPESGQSEPEPDPGQSLKPFEHNLPNVTSAWFDNYILKHWKKTI